MTCWGADVRHCFLECRAGLVVHTPHAFAALNAPYKTHQGHRAMNRKTQGRIKRRGSALYDLLSEVGSFSKEGWTGSRLY